ncbi:hypothetical protein BJ170DRAFT_372801 [Xylariales sp. AK1849]|nr:hypothetical protein BJ170DRAFT_372801 [Xylariales sp. AK1849]
MRQNSRSSSPQINTTLISTPLVESCQVPPSASILSLSLDRVAILESITTIVLQHIRACVMKKYGDQLATHTLRSRSSQEGQIEASELNTATESVKRILGKRSRSHTERVNNSVTGKTEDDAKGLDHPAVKRLKPCHQQKLACPYYKCDSARYSVISSCCGPGWDTISRLKEHLYRRHALPKFRCPRCFSNFENAESLSEYARAVKQCLVSDSDPFDGFGEEIEKSLRSRRRSGKPGGRETQWQEVYKTLFPTDDTITTTITTTIPSPYYDHAPHTQERTRYRQQALEEINSYICRELSPVLREELKTEIATELSIFEEQVKERAVEVFHKLIPKVLGRYQAKNEMTPPKSPNRDASSNRPQNPDAHNQGKWATPVPEWEAMLDDIDFNDLEPINFDNLELPMTFAVGNLQSRHPSSIYNPQSEAVNDDIYGTFDFSPGNSKRDKAAAEAVVPGTEENTAGVGNFQEWLG